MTHSAKFMADKAALRQIAIGGAVLGSGGGGDPYLGRLMAERVLGEDGAVPVIGLDTLPDDALILPIAMMGAPAVMQERFPSGKEIPWLIETMEKLMGRSVSAILCIEAGGLNSTIPFIASAQMGLPIVDADAMGRAFPELQMVTLTIGGLGATPMALADDKGNGVTFDTVSNTWTERLARAVTIEMGGAAMVSLYPFTARQGRDYLIHNSLSLIREIGEIVQSHRGGAPEMLAEKYDGAILFEGRVRDVERRSEEGFTRGQLELEGQGDFRGRKAQLSFQNEFLVAQENDRILASTPDLITLLDANSGTPETTETVKYGLPVKVLGLPCDPIWRSTSGLDLVGPKYFGFDFDYVPLNS